MVVLLILGGCDDEVVGFMSSNTGDSTLPGTSTGLLDETTDASTTSSGLESSSSASSGDAPALGYPRWVAYNFDSGIAVSHDDGETWMDVPDIDGMELHEDLARGEDWVVMVGGSDAARSADGVTWEHVDVDLGYARAVVYGAGGYASVGKDHLAWSLDGQTWEDARGGLNTFDLFAVTYAQGRFVAVGVEAIGASENGVDWTITGVGGEKLRSVTFGNGRFVAVGETGRIVETQDGVTVLRDAPGELPGAGEIDFCRGAFVAGGPNRFWTSPDAQTWTDVLLPNEGWFGCTDSAYIIPKVDGIFRSAALDELQEVYVPSQPLRWVRSTDAP